MVSNRRGCCSFHFHFGARTDEFRKADGVPVSQAHAAVAFGTPNGFGGIGAMESDSSFASACPENTHGIVGTRRELVEFLAASAFVKHGFVPAKLRGGDHVANFPVADMDEFLLTRSDRETSKKFPLGIVEGGNALFGIDDDAVGAEGWIGPEFLAIGDLLDIEGGLDIGDGDDVPGLKFAEIEVGVEPREAFFAGVKFLGHKFCDGSVSKVFVFGLEIRLMREGGDDESKVIFPQLIGRVGGGHKPPGGTENGGPIARFIAMHLIEKLAGLECEFTQFAVNLTGTEIMFVEINLDAEDGLDVIRGRRWLNGVDWFCGFF